MAAAAPWRRAEGRRLSRSTPVPRRGEARRAGSNGRALTWGQAKQEARLPLRREAGSGRRPRPLPRCASRRRPPPPPPLSRPLARPRRRLLLLLRGPVRHGVQRCRRRCQEAGGEACDGDRGRPHGRRDRPGERAGGRAGELGPRGSGGGSPSGGFPQGDPAAGRGRPAFSHLCFSNNKVVLH